MKQLFQIIIGIGFINLIVGILEFVSNTKLSGSIILAPILILTGFIGLFIHKKFKKQN